MLSTIINRRVCAGRSHLSKYQDVFRGVSQSKGVLRRIENLETRFSSTLPTTKSASKKSAYPERLLIYHAGTGRTVFIGCLKVTTIFIFAFFGLIVVPAHWQSPDEPAWVAPLVLMSGVIPMVFVAYTTRPFVSYVHLHLPLYARHSREYLHRYTANLPKTATMDITTMSIVGRPRVNKVMVSDLYPVKSRFGVANYARDTKSLDAKRPWWLGKSISEFSLKGGEGNAREKGVWENVAKSIAKSSK